MALKETSWVHRDVGALGWNPQGDRRRGRPKKTWKRTFEEEAMEMGKTRREVKRIAVHRICRKRFTDASREGEGVGTTSKGFSHRSQKNKIFVQL
jgi:hypothetical protein